MKKLDKTSFIQAINALQQVSSIQGKIYRDIRVGQNKVKFIRGGKTSSETIDLEELYELYLKVSQPTNQEARSYITGRVQSPAVSIINALGSTSQRLKTTFSNESTKPTLDAFISTRKVSTHNAKDNDETRFFNALAQVVGEGLLVSKSLGRPITSNYIFLPNDFKKYQLGKEAQGLFDQLLEALMSNRVFNGQSLAPHVDGMILGHPKLGKRIVEFDEEQHFTPALKVIMKLLDGTSLANPCTALYLQILDDLDYLNNETLSKHRINHILSTYPDDFKQFQEWLVQSGVRKSNYIAPKDQGFPFLGGRIAQRAYYDFLRNVAPHSPLNNGLSPTLRFPKKYFEDKCDVRFHAIPTNRITEIIKIYLQEVYKIGT